MIGRSLLLLAAAAALPPAVRGQEARDKPLKFTGDFSFVDTGGNSNVMTIGLGDKIEWRPGQYVMFRHTLNWVFGKTDGEESANQFLTGIRAELRFSERLNVFLGVTYDYDVHAGVKRRFEEYAGLGIRLVDTDRNRLKIDAGGTVFVEWAVGETEAHVVTAGRLVGDYRHLFTEKAYAQQSVAYLPNFERTNDYRLNSESTVVAPLNNFLAIKASYLMRTRGNPPEGFRRTDTIFRSGVQVSF